ncbi:ImuA family protein [Desertivirga xinjiangensis]|uniref:ImuA family protein n=1 Tax=Desertivirga xinjiangensis TaxID=539206 RepID=UPI00210F0FD0|nr:Error-prone repair protein ImuA [Pedobacter xinjiangensis]
MDSKKALIDKLQKDILLWQGYKAQPAGKADTIGLGQIESAFPNGVFPKRAIHEFITFVPEQSAASDGFIAGLLSQLMKEGAACVWVSTSRKLFPSSLSAFNVPTERIIFMDVAKEKDVLWIMEEALKCEGLAAVVAEINDLSLTESRRLQLAVENSGVTGFILRKDAGKKASSIVTARWKITPLPSENEDNLPGIGFPRWRVELLKVRNGSPGWWTLEWEADHFKEVVTEKVSTRIFGQEQRQIG